jgi:NAD-dependent deacetylase sirtuin 1
MARPILSTVTSADDVVSLLNRSKKIIVITGAGVSVSCGIPDFRSKESGLYNTLDCSTFGIPSAELMFDLEFFQIDPAPFYQFAPSLLPQKEMKPSICHRFVSLLETKKKLLRNYSQNVDGLERKTGMKNVLECHGTMAFFHCTGKKCKKKQSLKELEEDIKKGQVVYCPSCSEVMKPGVTFFGETVPKVFDKCVVKDVPRADLVVVIGTSLKVGGSVYELIRQIPQHVPQILINRDPVTLPKSMSDGFDVTLLGNCDDVVSYLSDRLEWTIPPYVDTDVDVDGSTTAAVGIKREREDTGACATATKVRKTRPGGGATVFPPSALWQCDFVSDRTYTIGPAAVKEEELV